VGRIPVLLVQAFPTPRVMPASTWGDEPAAHAGDHWFLVRSEVLDGVSNLSPELLEVRRTDDSEAVEPIIPPSW